MCCDRKCGPPKDPDVGQAPGAYESSHAMTAYLARLFWNWARLSPAVRMRRRPQTRVREHKAQQIAAAHDAEPAAVPWGRDGEGVAGRCSAQPLARGCSRSAAVPSLRLAGRLCHPGDLDAAAGIQQISVDLHPQLGQQPPEGEGRRGGGDLDGATASNTTLGTATAKARARSSGRRRGPSFWCCAWR